jgi:uncharacterized protein YecA (UPF0149 family)
MLKGSLNYNSMPTRTLYRTWCTTCQDWELFEFDWFEHDIDDNEKICRTCENPLESGTKIGDIPKEKLAEQRLRYKNYKKRQFQQTMNIFGMLGMGSNGMFNDFPQTDIIENDAGQEAIDAERRKLEQEEKQRRKEEVAKYHGLGRNEPCRCGSGNKYKKCCLGRVQLL